MNHIWVARPHANLSKRVSVVRLISVLLWRLNLFIRSVHVSLKRSRERPRTLSENHCVFILRQHVLAVIALNGRLCLNLVEGHLLVEDLEKCFSLHNQFILVTNLLKETVANFEAMVGLARLDNMGKGCERHTGWLQATAYVIVQPNEVHPREAVLH